MCARPDAAAEAGDCGVLARRGGILGCVEMLLGFLLSTECVWSSGVGEAPVCAEMAQRAGSLGASAPCVEQHQTRLSVSFNRAIEIR